jgi:hypothetical protein
METEKLNNEPFVEAEKKQNGGAREGAGRPKGSFSKETRERQEALRHFRARVNRRIDRLFNSQANLAEGVQLLIRKIKTVDNKGKQTFKHEVVENEQEIIEVLDKGLGDIDGVYYYITTRVPDNKAIDSLLDRAYGKASQSVDITSGGEQITGYAVEIIDKTEDVKKDDSEDTGNQNLQTDITS